MLAPACSRSVSEKAAFWRCRAEFWEAEATRLTAENATLAGTVDAQRQQVEALRQRVVTLSRMLFGTSSEKNGPGKPGSGRPPRLLRACHANLQPKLQLPTWEVGPPACKLPAT